MCVTGRNGNGADYVHKPVHWVACLMKEQSSERIRCECVTKFYSISKHCSKVLPDSPPLALFNSVPFKDILKWAVVRPVDTPVNNTCKPWQPSSVWRLNVQLTWNMDPWLWAAYLALVPKVLVCSINGARCNSSLLWVVRVLSDITCVGVAWSKC